MARRDSQRAAWTAWVESGGTLTEGPKENKYHVAPKDERGKYASKHEAVVAGSLDALQRAGKISELREQVRIVLVPGDGKLRPIAYIADFTYKDADGFTHICDAKSGFTAKLPVYRLKKRLASLLLGLTIEEI